MISMPKRPKAGSFRPPLPPTQPVDPLHGLIEGYPILAGRMGLAPETAMFKRFGALNSRNSLYMQNKLMFPEGKLKMAEADAAAVKSDRFNYRRDFWCILNSEIVDPDTI